MADKSSAKTSKSRQEGAAFERRRLFIEAMLSNGENITQAALAAGFSPKTAAQQGSRLLKNVEVQQALNSRRAEVLGKFQLTTERVTQEIARISFFDPRKMFAKDGSPLAITDLDDDTAACIVGLEVLEQYEGSGESRVLVGNIKKYKIADKNSGLDKAAKMLGLYKKDNEQPNAALAEAVKDAASIAPLKAAFAKRLGRA